jgi:hypothetical protein
VAPRKASEAGLSADGTTGDIHFAHEGHANPAGSGLKSQTQGFYEKRSV